MLTHFSFIKNVVHTWHVDMLSSWLLGPSCVMVKITSLFRTRILLLYYILLGHKRSIGGILPFCWVRWPCGWCLLPVTWFSWSLKDLTRIVILLPCQFFSHFVLTVHLHRLQNSSWNSIRGSKNLSPLCVLRARVLFNLLPGLKAFLLFPHSWSFSHLGLTVYLHNLQNLSETPTCCLTWDLIKPRLVSVYGGSAISVGRT